MRVLITRGIPQAGLNILNIYNDRIEVDYLGDKRLSETELMKRAAGASALLVGIYDKVTKEVIKSGGKNLKLISTFSVGYDHMDLGAAAKSGVYVPNTPGNFTVAVAEHTIALMFAAGRNIALGDRFCREKDHKYFNPIPFTGPVFTGKTLGIIGFGKIGQQIARIAKNGLGMEIFYHDVVRHSEAETLLNVQNVSLDTLLNDSDVITVNCPLNEQTYHLIDEKKLKRMKPLSYLINTSRGGVVNEESLIWALKNNVIKGAGLDVFENEPKINPELKSLPNVVLTPHIGSATLESKIHMARMSAENIIDVLINNQPPRYPVQLPLRSLENNHVPDELKKKNKSAINKPITSLIL